MGVLSQHAISVEASNFINNDGVVYFFLFSEEQELSFDSPHVARLSSKVVKGKSTVVFKNIPKGKYAIMVFHDEDNNGEMRHYFFGPPKEGVGASNNPKGHPKIEEALFLLSQDISLVIEMKYVFR